MSSHTEEPLKAIDGCARTVRELPLLAPTLQRGSKRRRSSVASHQGLLERPDDTPTLRGRLVAPAMSAASGSWWTRSGVCPDIDANDGSNQNGCGRNRAGSRRCLH
jgi:hypothetical protein